MRILRFLHPVCPACGRPARRGNPLVRAGGFRVHRSHTTDPSTSFYRGRRR